MAQFGTADFQELIFQRYANPAGYLNGALQRGKFNTATSTILHRQDMEKCWSLYLACFSNPFWEPITFDDFLKKAQPEPDRPKPAQRELTRQQAQERVKQADKILHGFVPGKKRGEPK